MPYVTIIIPYKTNFKYLISALNSVLKQSYKFFKVLIIYDNEDRSDFFKLKKFLSKIKKKNKISIILNKKNLGAGESRNVGIQNSHSKYVAFLDSDDLWTKNKLKIQINFMKKNRLQMSHTSYYIVNSNNKIISKREVKEKLLYNDLIKSCDIGLSTVVLETKLFKKKKIYFPNISTKEDYVLWLKIIKKLKIIKGIDLKLARYRRSKNSLSANKILALKNGYKIYREYMKFSIFKSFLSLIILSVNYLKKFIYDFYNNHKL
ncbi:glycosyltransferase family 2 protein [Candidatus Pelagibacter communis]|uniref:glycosyltransferase family 2 protein n=1 Tax=Pelagibacter ubique TaxID=198252 RepID=UPI00094D8A33|nr:glycosyltransferase family 2 protein [Candidatus Pelagibacter ubique]